jgi:hypothetical protein
MSLLTELDNSWESFSTIFPPLTGLAKFHPANNAISSLDYNSVGRLETVEDFVPWNRAFLERFLTFGHALAVGRGRIGVAI